MINRIFFISDTIIAGTDMPAEENVYFSVLVNHSAKENLEKLYSLAEMTTISPFNLALDLREPLNADSLRHITSFLFLPSYLYIDYRPVINLLGESKKLLAETASLIAGYLSAQAINDVIINSILTPFEGPLANGYPLFESPAELVIHYQSVLGGDHCYNNNIFFRTYSAGIMQSTLLSLQQEEIDFKERLPKLYSLINNTILLKKELSSLKRKNSYIETELSHQKQYVDILKAEHPIRELQDYYNHEYEILPLWYKRFGHLLKVITGKRRFKSLFNDNIKKHKD